MRKGLLFATMRETQVNTHSCETILLYFPILFNIVREVVWTIENKIIIHDFGGCYYFLFLVHAFFDLGHGF